MLDAQRLFELGFTPSHDSEDAVRLTARVLVEEIGRP